MGEAIYEASVQVVNRNRGASGPPTLQVPPVTSGGPSKSEVPVRTDSRSFLYNREL